MRFLSHTSKKAFEGQMLDRAEGEVKGMLARVHRIEETLKSRIRN